MSEAGIVEVDCGEAISIADVGDLYAKLLVHLAEGEKVNLKVSNIERIDAAAMQIFYAFYKDSLAQGHAINWESPSEAFTRSAALLGLAERMNIDESNA